jgi:hypothetical protein
MADRGRNFLIGDLRGKSDKKEGPSTPGRPSLTPSKPFDYGETDATGWRTFKHPAQKFSVYTFITNAPKNISRTGRKKIGQLTNEKTGFLRNRFTP